MCIRDSFHILQCYNCQSFGHNSKSCNKIDEPTCLYCSGKHKSKGCTKKNNRDEHKCSNCTKKNFSNKHTSNSKKCPLLLKQLEKVINMTSLNPKN